MANRLNTAATLIALTVISACSSGALSLLTGGGPNIAANTQVGKENYQGVTTSITTNKNVTPSVTPQAPVENLTQDNSTNNTTNTPPWMVILLVIGWLLPSPSEIGRGALNAIKAIRNRK